MKKRAIWIVVGAVLLLAICGYAFRKGLVRSYVMSHQERLELFAEELLSGERDDRSFGLWRVDCYRKQGVVEFITGGFGLAPDSDYEGFYYSSSDEHRSAFGGGLPMQVEGDSATWSDGTDNGGESTRFAENWFWFKAWF